MKSKEKQSSTPQLPFKRPHIPTNRGHKALNRGTLGGLGEFLAIVPFMLRIPIHTYGNARPALPAPPSWFRSSKTGSKERSSQPRPPNVPLLRALWLRLVGMWVLLKSSWGVLEGNDKAVLRRHLKLH